MSDPDGTDDVIEESDDDGESDDPTSVMRFDGQRAALGKNPDVGDCNCEILLSEAPSNEGTEESR